MQVAVQQSSTPFLSLNKMGGNHSKEPKNKPSVSEPMAAAATAQTQSTDEPQPPPWAELLGQNNWTNLLDPLDLHLRTLILRCGDFCQATYDTFNNDANSKYAGSSRYGHSNFFDKVMLQDAPNYQIASFLYATAQVSVPEALLLHSMSRESWDRESNWIGYVAVTTDAHSKTTGRREIYIAWRGTTRNYEWINVMGAELQSADALLNPHTNNQDDSSNVVVDAATTSSSPSSSDDDEDEEAKVMRGWLSMYTSSDANSAFTKTSARAQLSTTITQLKDKYKGEKLSVALTGHSLGASLAVISAFDLVENGIITDDIPVAAFVFGCPQVGNKAFKSRIAKHPNLKILHAKNGIDVIPHYPGRLLGYRNIGTDLVIDTRKSPYLKDSKDPGDWHNLQAMLHIVAGWNGENGDFELRVKRSVALVNKSCDFLKAECGVPAMWWVEKNKGMVRDESTGEWFSPPPADEDLPVPEY